VFKLFTGPSNARLLGPLPLEKIRFFAGVGLAWAAGKGKSKMGKGLSVLPLRILFALLSRSQAEQRLPPPVSGFATGFTRF
jgi:hypothetical protein